MKKALLAISMLLASHAAIALEFATDMAAATKAAKESKKDIVIVVGTSGPDTDKVAGMTKSLIEKISTEAVGKLSGSYVFVKVVDAPEAVRERAAAWGATEIPAAIVVDADGRTMAVIYSHGQVPADEYATVLMAIQIARAEFKAIREKAAAAQGVEKAKLLHASLFHLTKFGVFANGSTSGHRSAIDEVIALDPEELGPSWKLYLLLGRVQELVDGVAFGDPRGKQALVEIDSFVEANSAHKGVVQQALIIKADIQFQEGDLAGALKTLKKARDLNPESLPGKEAQKLIQGVDGGVEGGKK